LQRLSNTISDHRRAISAIAFRRDAIAFKIRLRHIVQTVAETVKEEGGFLGLDDLQ
jgi:hypothetical protein